MSGHLRFQARPSVKFEIVRCDVFLDGDRQILQRRAVADQRAIVFDDALKRLPREIEPVESRILALQLRQHAQRLRIVIEALITFHARVEHIFTGVTERRVAEVVGHAEAFSEIVVQPHDARDAARDLGHFERMCQPRAVVIALVRNEDLCFAAQAPKGARMDHPILIALERRARLACRFFM